MISKMRSNKLNISSPRLLAQKLVKKQWTRLESRNGNYIYLYLFLNDNIDFCPLKEI